MAGLRRRGDDGASRARMGSGEARRSRRARRDRHAFRDAADDDSTVEIPVGGTVGFSYPSGNGRHNVVFATLQPTACKQTAGDVWGATPPLPWYQQGPGWAGTCTFDKPGTYEFHSGLNSD